MFVFFTRNKDLIYSKCTFHISLIINQFFEEKKMFLNILDKEPVGVFIIFHRNFQLKNKYVISISQHIIIGITYFILLNEHRSRQNDRWIEINNKMLSLLYCDELLERGCEVQVKLKSSEFYLIPDKII